MGLKKEARKVHTRRIGTYASTAFSTAFALRLMLSISPTVGGLFVPIPLTAAFTKLAL